jgi:peptidoglycan/LPS O-acetylase OafA/YrhL
MQKSESIYLDAVRVIAALMVYFSHFREGVPDFFPDFGGGHLAVIIFFVLSGYVIAWVADTKERNSRDYILSRFARLYSVAIPALILTLVCDRIGLFFNHELYGLYGVGDWPLVRLGAALTFSSEFWFLSIQTLSNGPYWSLCYEFWYYMLFAACIYFRGQRRIFLVLFIMLLIGPKILSLMPAWLLGVVIYRTGVGRHAGFRVGLLLFLASFIGFYLSGRLGLVASIRTFNRELLGPEGMKNFEYANDFMCDYLAAFWVFLNIVGARAMAPHVVIPGSIEVVVRFLASFTLSIYLFHNPLLKMLTAAFGTVMTDGLGLVVFVVSILIIGLLGWVTEHRKKQFRCYLEVLETWLTAQLWRWRASRRPPAMVVGKGDLP